MVKISHWSSYIPEYNHLIVHPHWNSQIGYQGEKVCFCNEEVWRGQHFYWCLSVKEACLISFHLSGVVVSVSSECHQMYLTKRAWILNDKTQILILSSFCFENFVLCCIKCMFISIAFVILDNWFNSLRQNLQYLISQNLKFRFSISISYHE